MRRASFLMAGLFFISAAWSSGTVTLLSAPQYGVPLTVGYHIKPAHEIKGALLCWQGPVVQLKDYSLVEVTAWLDPHASDGTYSLPLAGGTLDYTKPAQCMTYVFREPTSGNQSGTILTNVLTFALP